MYGEVENTIYRSCIFSENALIDSIPRISIKEPTEIINLLCDICIVFKSSLAERDGTTGLLKRTDKTNEY